MARLRHVVANVPGNSAGYSASIMLLISPRYPNKQISANSSRDGAWARPWAAASAGGSRRVPRRSQDCVAAIHRFLSGVPYPTGDAGRGADRSPALQPSNQVPQRNAADASASAIGSNGDSAGLDENPGDRFRFNGLQGGSGAPPGRATVSGRSTPLLFSQRKTCAGSGSGNAV